MAANLQLDQALIEKALKLGGHPKKRAAVNVALESYAQRLEQQEIIALFGQIETDPIYDYKRQRKRG